MDVRIGVTHNPREIEIELADGTDPESLKGSLEQALAERRRHASGSPTGRVGRSVSRSTSSPTSSSEPPRISVASASEPHRTLWMPNPQPARPAPAVRHRQGRSRQDQHRGRARVARVAARQANARRRSRRQGQPRRLLRGRPRRTSSPARSSSNLFAMSMHTEESLKEYLRLQLKVPLRGAHRAAGAHLRLRRPRRTGRQGDPHGRQVPVGGPRAPLRPRGRRRGSDRPRRRAARGAEAHQRAGEGRHGARPDRMDARHPRRPDVVRAR